MSNVWALAPANGNYNNAANWVLPGGVPSSLAIFRASLVTSITFSSNTTIGGGTLALEGRLTGTTVIGNGATLAGSGTADGEVTVNAGGMLSPGIGVGRFTSGNVELKAGARFMVEIGGQAVPGIGFDQLNVVGTVTLSGAVLEVARLGNGPSNDAPGHFFIIDNDGFDPVQGIFAGLAEGATTVLAGRFYTITYRGGTGNDVMLTSGGARIAGTAGDDTISGSTSPAATQMANEIREFGGNDRLYGGGGNDVLQGDAGDDMLYGGIGTDRAYFTGRVSDYEVAKSGARTVVSHRDGAGVDGTDTLIGIEFMVFSDQTIAV